ncbi:UbiA family prenyltransferase [Streptomyces cremeus]|uniref:UbiA family prenyltransferase n=1 Tax=Streptomyces cremeus TaxID=66881 RepID=UPI0031E512F5
MSHITLPQASLAQPSLPLPTARPTARPAARTGAFPPAHLRHCLAEARPLVQVMFVLRFTTGALLAASEAHRLPDVRHLLPGLLCWWAATTCVYLFNGVTDLPEDRANGSVRPLARGVLPERTARRVVGALAATALLAACAAGLVVAESALVFLALGFAYSAPSVAAKRRTWSASLVTSAAAATTYLAGASAADGALTAEVLVFAIVLSLGVGLIAAVAKDLGSAEGDALGGRRTLVVVRGERAARVFCAVLGGLLALGLTVAAVFVHRLPLDLSAAVLVVGAGWLAVRCLHVSDPEVNARAPYRTWMVTQYAVHLVALAALLLPE